MDKSNEVLNIMPTLIKEIRNGCTVASLTKFCSASSNTIKSYIINENLNDINEYFANKKQRQTYVEYYKEKEHCILVNNIIDDICHKIPIKDICILHNVSEIELSEIVYTYSLRNNNDIVFEEYAKLDAENSYELEYRLICYEQRKCIYNNPDKKYDCDYEMEIQRQVIELREKYNYYKKKYSLK